MKHSATPQQVLQIRAEFASGTLDTRAWAAALDVSLETIRRIGRGDTYRHVGRVKMPAATSQSPRAPSAPEPTEEEIAASLASLQRRLGTAPVTGPGVDSLVDELTRKGRESR